MSVLTSGRIRVGATFTGDDKFVHRGNVITEVWFTQTTSGVKSNTVWFRGVDFYTGGKTRGRMRFDDLPPKAILDIRQAVERLRALAP